MLTSYEKNNLKPDQWYDCNGNEFYIFAIEELRSCQLEV